MDGEDFAKGLGKGTGAFGVGYLAQTALKAATGARLSLKGTVDSLNAFNPLAGQGPAANFVALAGSLGLSGVGNAIDGERHPDAKAAAKVLGYGILGALGALFSLLTIDPPDSPPEVIAQYKDWIPGYAAAPQTSFRQIVPATPPGSLVTDLAVQVPRFSNLF